jgi:hypothetical protein
MKNKLGQKGFIKLPENEVKNKRISAYFNEIEREKIITFAKENNVTHTELIRSRLKDIIG